MARFKWSHCNKSDSDYRKRHRNFADFFCPIHICSPTLLICSQAGKTMDIVSSIAVFTREWASPTDLSCFTDKTYIGGRSYSSTTDNLLDFCTQKKLRSIYRHNFIVINCGLIPWWNIKRCLQFSRNSNLQLSLVLFFYFSVVIQSGEFLARVWQEEGNFQSEVLKRCYIQVYPTIVFFLR